MGTENCTAGTGICAAEAVGAEVGETCGAVETVCGVRAAAYAEHALAARVESAAFSLLSRCLLRPVRALSDDIAAGKVSARIDGLLDSACGGVVARCLETVRSFGVALSTLDGESARLRMEVEYNRLFVGPGKLAAPPYESYYRSDELCAGTRRLRTEPEREVLQAYAALGYTMPDTFVELPDHIAVELEFLALAAAREADAWDAGDKARARDVRAAADAFVEAHAARWFEPFARDVHAGAHLPFYPAIIDLACLLVIGKAPDEEAAR